MMGEIPLAPQKAIQSAKEWLQKRNVSTPELLGLTIMHLGSRAEEFEGKFFYAVHCVTGAFDSMYVVILMDGTIVEPEEVPRN